MTTGKENSNEEIIAKTYTDGERQRKYDGLWYAISHDALIEIDALEHISSSSLTKGNTAYLCKEDIRIVNKMAIEKGRDFFVVPGRHSRKNSNIRSYSSFSIDDPGVCESIDKHYIKKMYRRMRRQFRKQLCDAARRKRRK